MRAERAWPAAALAALLALPAPAAAQQRPAFPPTRDVAATYRVSIAAPGVPSVVELRFSARTGRARLDGDLPAYVLVDLNARRASIVMDQLGVMVDAPPAAGLDQALVLEDGKRFTRRGSDVVAGLRCTVWDVVADAASGTACVTADGVVLRASGHDRQGRTGSLEATRVTYGRQPEALFFPPPNVQRIELGAAAGAALGGILGRLPAHP
jgi:hypothetical protein